jgi:hypothetical protein
MLQVSKKAMLCYRDIVFQRVQSMTRSCFARQVRGCVSIFLFYETTSAQVVKVLVSKTTSVLILPLHAMTTFSLLLFFFFFFFNTKAHTGICIYRYI